MGPLALITGSSSGIGAAIARKLHASGYQVLLTGRDETRLKKLQSELSGSLALACDLRESTQLAKLVEFTKQTDRPLKALINNAGITRRKPFVETEEKIWLELFQVNLFSAVNLTRMLYPLLKDSAPSSVLNISSSLGLKPIPDTSAYSASKAAMINWTNTLALEWAKDQIRANCIAPGIVDTPIHAFHAEGDDSEIRKQMHALQPLKRMGRSEEIAEAAEFLISEKSAWTTGTTLTVDGGVHLV